RIRRGGFETRPDRKSGFGKPRQRMVKGYEKKTGKALSQKGRFLPGSFLPGASTPSRQERTASFSAKNLWEVISSSFFLPPRDFGDQRANRHRSLQNVEL
ncbi:MAG TPA: hypothetical protein PLA90_14265, partial [Candidatus Sumerlaeota bacterium]|nr:hypothetical protein [Candidatus Sumerlaeota bacterium]